MTKFRGVEGGTPTGDPLCRTCIFATYMRGAQVSDVKLFCQCIQKFLGTEKMNCSQYQDRRHATLDNMYKTAWYLRTDEFSKVIGFVSPRQWRTKFSKEAEENEPI